MLRMSCFRKAELHARAYLFACVDAGEAIARFLLKLFLFGMIVKNIFLSAYIIAKPD